VADEEERAEKSDTAARKDMSGIPSSAFLSDDLLQDVEDDDEIVNAEREMGSSARSGNTDTVMSAQGELSA
jgi:hypothetical protein